MNEANHAQCLEVAATCAGEILQMESCPLQFACAERAASGEPTGPYDPCAGRECGETCHVCPPGDAECIETAVVKMCNANGECRPEDPGC
jgi:hypothetical protein